MVAHVAIAAAAIYDGFMRKISGLVSVSGKAGFAVSSSLFLRLVTGGMVAATALWIGWLNHMTPLMADDWCMALSGWRQIPGFLYAHYFVWGGRIPAQLVATVFLQLDKSVFDVANTLALLMLLFLMSFMAAGRSVFAPGNGMRGPATWLAAFCLLWLGLPAFGEVVFWLSGSANYLWTTLVLMLFLAPYIHLAMGRGDLFFARPRLAAFLWPLVGFIAGWTNENAAPSVFVLAGFLALYVRFVAHEALPRWAIVSPLALGAGFAALALAPGNMVRLHSGPFDAYLARGFFERILHFSSRFPKYVLFLCWPVWLAFLLVFILRARTKTAADTRTRDVAIILASGVFLNVGALVLSPYVEKRALTAGIALLITAVLLLAQNLTPRLCAALAAAALLAALPSFFSTNLKYRNTAEILHRQNEALALCRVDGPAATACPLPTPTGLADAHYTVSRFGEVSAEPDNWVNVCRARRSGVSAIRRLYVVEASALN